MKSSLFITSSSALLLGIASAFLALIGETTFSFIALLPSLKSLFSSVEALNFFFLTGIVCIEEVSCYCISRSFWSSLHRWTAPFLLGLGFFLVESSLAPLLTTHSLSFPSPHFLPILFVHISTFAFYLSTRRHPLLSLSGGISIHFGYNLLAFFGTTFLILLIISTLVFTISTSFFLARLLPEEYTEGELN